MKLLATSAQREWPADTILMIAINQASAHNLNSAFYARSGTHLENWKLCALVACHIVLTACSQFSANERVSHVSAKSLHHEQRLVDLAVFQQAVVQEDVSFSANERRRAQLLVEELAHSSRRLSDAEFTLALARIAALPGNGHTGLLWVPAALRYNKLQVSFLSASDGIFIAAAADQHSHLVGRKVERIAGRSVAEWRKYFAELTGGLPGYREESFLVFLECPEFLEAAGAIISDGQVEVKLADGRIELIQSAAWNTQPEGVWSFFPQARAIELSQAGWISNAPLYLQEPEAAMRVKAIEGGRIAYIQFRSNVDFSHTTDLQTESASLVERLAYWRPHAIVIDQRFNFGGDLNTTRELMREIPHLVAANGPVIAITSGRTFSAGIASLAYLKQAAGPRLAIVGAPAGDSLEFFAEGGDPIVLPNSKLHFLRALERHNYMTGCPEADCHAAIRRWPIRIDSIQPNLEPAFTYEDYVRGRDPYLDAALEIARSRLTGAD